MMIELWIPLGSALLGALVGGAASLGASVIVDRVRLCRETRVRIYDVLLDDALGKVGRLHLLAGGGQIDANGTEAVESLARLRRAAVIASRKDVRKIRTWQDAYDELGKPVRVLHAMGSFNRGAVGPAKVTALLQRIEEHCQRILRDLHEYSQWLEHRLAGQIAGSAYPSREER